MKVERYIAPTDGRFRLKDVDPDEHGSIPSKSAAESLLARSVERLHALQEVLYAQDRWGVLLILQAMDTAGKDGAIEHVMSGVNPQGCQVYSFKPPSQEELRHDFLWRVQRALPERGRIGIFNRSHYEEVLVVRVHPEYLVGQRLPHMPKDLDELWEERFDSINEAERHWARNGAVIVKFFLNVSQKEQHKRFLERIVDPDHNWKFSAGDIKESAHWDDYQNAYETALKETSKPWAPWYCIPADSKSYMRRMVAETIVDTLAQLDISYPVVTQEDKLEMEKVRRKLEAEMG